jgi:hypothetical protein
VTPGPPREACSWQYGWERARTSVTSFFAPAAAAAGIDPDRLDSWLPGATSADRAEENCHLPPLTAGGDVVLAQYVRGGLDRNIACE